MRIRSRIMQLEKYLFEKESERPTKINMDDHDQVAEHLLKHLILGFEHGFFKSYDKFKHIEEDAIVKEIENMIENDHDEFLNLLLTVKSWLVENRKIQYLCNVNI